MTESSLESSQSIISWWTWDFGGTRPESPVLVRQFAFRYIAGCCSWMYATPIPISHLDTRAFSMLKSCEVIQTCVHVHVLELSRPPAAD